MRSTTQSDDNKQEDDWSSTPVHTTTAQISRDKRDDIESYLRWFQQMIIESGYTDKGRKNTCYRSSKSKDGSQNEWNWN